MNIRCCLTRRRAVVNTIGATLLISIALPHQVALADLIDIKREVAQTFDLTNDGQTFFSIRAGLTKALMLPASFEARTTTATGILFIT